jgi:hypothetical protein
VPDLLDDVHAEQAAGDKGAAGAPQPLQDATRDLGVQYRPASTDPNIQRDAVAGSENSIAGVEENEPRQVEVNDEEKFENNADQVVPHELYHVWANNLPPSVRAKIPASTQADYAEPTVDSVNALHRQGKTLLDLPGEQGAQLMAWSAMHPDDRKVQAAMKPYLDDMRNTSLSVIQATGPHDKQINTTPRAPAGPRDDIPGMEGFHITPGQNKLIRRPVAEQYVDKAKGNPAVARIMAAHDGHRF